MGYQGIPEAYDIYFEPGKGNAFIMKINVFSCFPSLSHKCLRGHPRASKGLQGPPSIKLTSASSYKASPMTSNYKAPKASNYKAAKGLRL